MHFCRPSSNCILFFICPLPRIADMIFLVFCKTNLHFKKKYPEKCFAFDLNCLANLLYYVYYQFW